MYYAFIKDEKIIGVGQVKTLNDDIQNIEITQEEFENIERYKYSDGEIILNPDYEAEQAQKERERLDMLSLTKREVFLALYKDKGITPDALKSQITDPAALIEFEYANDYYRGNPLIALIGEQLGYTSDELDYLFEHGEFEAKPIEENNGTGEASTLENESSNPPVNENVDELEESEEE